MKNDNAGAVGPGEASFSTIDTRSLLDLAHRLIDTGIPVLRVPFGRLSNIPSEWQRAQPDRRAVARFRPGVDALVMVTGHGIDVVDEDTKVAGNSVDNLPPFEHYGKTATPSGGAHYLVPGSGLRTRRVAGVGDYQAGDRDGQGRGLVFLPGSVRADKYPDGGYIEAEPWQVDACIAATADPDLLLTLGDDEPNREKYVDASPARTEPGLHPYAEAAIARELARLRNMQEDGWDGEPWDSTTYAVGCRLVEFANSAWTGYMLDQAAEDLSTNAPTDAEFGPREHLAKWESALQTVGNGAVPEPGSREPVALMATDEPMAGLAGGWGAIDLTGFLDGTYEPLQAELLCRDDDVALLYPGLVHSLHGEAESGKSMIAQFEAVQQMKAGRPVCIVDYESDGASVVERLLLMGATREQIASLLTYVRPEQDPEANDSTRAAFDALLQRRFALVVLDGVNEALTQMPARERSTAGLGGNDHITAWQRRLPRKIAERTGAAVVLIDHVAKGDGGGRFAIGGQAKLAALSGAGYVVRPTSPLGKGLVGSVELWVAKDRPGYVRQHSSPDFTADRMQLSAVVQVDGVGGLTIQVQAPPMRSRADDANARVRMRVLDFLRDLPADHDGAGINLIKRSVSGKDSQIAEALKVLVELGEVEVAFRGQSKLHRLPVPA